MNYLLEYLTVLDSFFSNFSVEQEAFDADDGEKHSAAEGKENALNIVNSKIEELNQKIGELNEKIWELAGEKYDYFKKNSERLKNWKNILSTAPVVAMNVAFLPICISEYYFSKSA